MSLFPTSSSRSADTPAALLDQTEALLDAARGHLRAGELARAVTATAVFAITVPRLEESLTHEEAMAP